MTIEQLGSLGEFIAAIATLITLVYLALQIRHNTAAMNESRKLAITESQRDWTAMFAESMHLRADSKYLMPALLKYSEHGEDALDVEERSRIGNYMAAMAARMDAMHLQYQNGFLDEETYRATFVGTVKSFGNSWLKFGSGMQFRRESFVREVNRILDEGVQHEV